MTMNSTPANSRTVLQGTCENCFNSFAAWHHYENRSDIPEPEEWESPSECPVCGEYLGWDFSDPLTPTIRTGYYPEEFQESNNV